MKISKKRLNFLAFIVEVWFTDSAPEEIWNHTGD